MDVESKLSRERLAVYVKRQVVLTEERRGLWEWSFVAAE
jgi:hypothetical protein